MPRKKRVGSDFGDRLVAIRKERAVTQVDLAKAIGSTQRAISYYETRADYPPAGVVAKLAQALGVTADELLGVASKRLKKSASAPDPNRKIQKKVELLLSLPEKDQRAVFRLINSLATASSNNGKRSVA